VSIQTQQAPAPPSANGVAPAAVRIAPVRRRSPAMVSLGVLLVVVGALAAWHFVAGATGGAHAYLAVYRPVAMGDKVTADDLQSVTLTPARGLTPIPASRADRVVGEYAAVPLVPGTLLADAQLVASNAVGAGQALVGLDLSPMQRPNRTFVPGEKVQLISVPPPNTGSSDGSGPSPQSTMPTMTATVVGVGDPDADDDTVVDVVVPKDSAPVVAWYADQNRVALVLVASG